MSRATTTKFVWFREGWDELKQHLAYKPCVKWHVLLLLPILSAFRVIQSPSTKMYNDERGAGLQTPRKARLRSAQYHPLSAPFGAEARVKGSGWRQDVYGGRGARGDWGKDSRKKWCLCWTLKAPAGVGKMKWTWHCQKLKPHFRATASDCFAWHFLPPFPWTYSTFPKGSWAFRGWLSMRPGAFKANWERIGEVMSELPSQTSFTLQRYQQPPQSH